MPEQTLKPRAGFVIHLHYALRRRIPIATLFAAIVELKVLEAEATGLGMRT